MKRIKFIWILAVLGLFLGGCSKPKADNVDVEEVAHRLAQNAEIPSASYEDLTKIENAEKYLLSADDFTQGVAVYSPSTEQADKIILIKARDTKTVQDVERALADVLVGLTNTWESDEEQAKKVEDHILKTKDKYVLLYVGQKKEEAEKIFDEAL